MGRVESTNQSLCQRRSYSKGQPGIGCSLNLLLLDDLHPLCDQLINLLMDCIYFLQLRDPGILVDDDGAIYMFYTGAGENCIGVAKLNIK